MTKEVLQTLSLLRHTTNHTMKGEAWYHRYTGIECGFSRFLKLATYVAQALLSFQCCMHVEKGGGPGI